MSNAIEGPRAAPASGSKPKQIIILLHGYGMNGDTLLGFVPYWSATLPDALFLAPNAPTPCPGAPGGFVWWPLDDYRGSTQAAAADKVSISLQLLIGAERGRYDVPASQIALVGFSQGATLALHMGPRQLERIGGVVSYAGMLADPSRLRADTRSTPPVLLVHGDADTMMPVREYYIAKAALAELDFDVEGHVTSGLGHTIDADGLNRGSRFLTEAFG